MSDTKDPKEHVGGKRSPHELRDMLIRENGTLEELFTLGYTCGCESSKENHDKAVNTLSKRINELEQSLTEWQRVAKSKQELIDELRDGRDRDKKAVRQWAKDAILLLDFAIPYVLDHEDGPVTRRMADVEHKVLKERLRELGVVV